MRLIYTKSRKEVQVGDLVECHNAGEVKVVSFSKPHRPSASGKVAVREGGQAHTSEYYVGVIGAEWVDREDRAVCPNCDQWADSPQGDCMNQCKKRGFA